METPLKNEDKASQASVGGKIVRLLLPVALLAAGWYGFSKLSEKPEAAKEAPKETRAIKTRVAELEVVDFQTVITTQGTVRSHEEVPLSSQVAGEITRIHPNFEDGAFFGAGEILLEIDPSDFAPPQSQQDRRAYKQPLKKRIPINGRFDWGQEKLKSEMKILFSSWTEPD